MRSPLFLALLAATLAGCATSAPDMPRYTARTTDPGYTAVPQVEVPALGAWKLTTPSTQEAAPTPTKTIAHLSKDNWDALSPDEQAKLQDTHAVRTHQPDRYGVITDVQTVDQSTPGTSGGAALGGAVASAAYIDRSLRGNSYSVGANLAVGILGAMLGSAADSAPVQQYKTRYTVKLADGEVQYFDEVKADSFRHSPGVCIHVPEITLATQNLCNQTVDGVRKRYFSQR